MTTTTYKSNSVSAIALLLALPTAIFLFIVFLKFGLGVPGPLDSIAPTLMEWGLDSGPGLNITSLILFGPPVAFLLTIFQVLKISVDMKGEFIRINMQFEKRWFTLFVAVFSTIVIGGLILFLDNVI